MTPSSYGIKGYKYNAAHVLAERQGAMNVTGEADENDYFKELGPTGYCAPGYDAVQLLDAMTLKVLGQGGHIEQSLTYVDPLSARAWLRIAKQQDYQNVQHGIPTTEVAEAVRDALNETPDWDHKSLEVILLGPADAQKEIKLVRALLETIPNLQALYVCLMDISQLLLSHAERNVAEAFKDDKVHLLSLAGNFLQLPMYRDIFFKPPGNKRKRLIVMLGYTFGNLDSELEFVRDSLGGFRTDDMFLADFGLSVFAPANDPEKLKEKDPYLHSTYKWKKTLEDFIVGPFKRNREDVKYIEFSPVLDNKFCAVTDSYCVELRVTLVCKDGSEKNFRVHRLKRYNAKELVHAVCAEGWEARNGWTYGPLQDRALYLWRKL